MDFRDIQILKSYPKPINSVSPRMTLGPQYLECILSDSSALPDLKITALTPACTDFFVSHSDFNVASVFLSSSLPRRLADTARMHAHACALAIPALICEETHLPSACPTPMPSPHKPQLSVLVGTSVCPAQGLMKPLTTGAGPHSQ